MPETVFSSSSPGLTTIRSSRGFRLKSFLAISSLLQRLALGYDEC
jgi:hypothetical protein